jgi:DNA polymerase-1
VLAFAAQLPVTRQLVTLADDVEFEFSLEAMRAYTGLNVPAVKPIFEELGFNRLTEQLESFGRRGLRPMSSGEAARRSRSIAGALRAGRYAGKARKRFAQRLGEVECARNRYRDDRVESGGGAARGHLHGMGGGWAYYIPVRAVGGERGAARRGSRCRKPILEDPKHRKMGQNIKYDLVVLRQAGIDLAGVDFDTMIASFVLDPLRRSHGMDALPRNCSDIG